MAPQRLLVIGTTNVAKGRELQELLAPYELTVRTLRDYPTALAVEEDGDTFADNARKKAVEQARHLGVWVLADDSGLEVKALDGRPGIYSARYAGESATDAANNEKLLEELGDLPTLRRAARYFCHVALADPQGEVRAESDGVCNGRVTMEPRGTNGFGYDPLFELVEYHRTFGELGPRAKAALSHRARALRAIAPKLAALIVAGAWEATHENATK
jgi:XTP/dITP diphosphohydrolase